MNNPQEKVSAKDECLAQVLSSPGQWGQSYLQNRDGGRRVHWPHQVDDLECRERNIIHLDGRDTGKTAVLTTLALHYAFIKKGGSVLIAAPHQGHLDTISDEIEFQIDNNPELMSSLALTAQGRPKITRKPYFKIEFKNDSVIYFRPAGTYGDAFRSLHVDYVLVDEGAWLTEKAWKALRQCLKAKGNDHIIDAVRCALLVREQLQDGGGWDSSTIELVTPLQTEPLNW